jgi:hypothetical protein
MSTKPTWLEISQVHFFEGVNNQESSSALKSTREKSAANS